MRIIKKYKNRILYDTQTSRPVTLKQLAAMSRDNVPLKILDNVSGRDITRLTILQAILAQERAGRCRREVIPQMLSWTRVQLDITLREIMENGRKDMQFVREWAEGLVHDAVCAGIISSEKETAGVEMLMDHIGDVGEEVISFIEQRLDERVEAAILLLGDTAGTPVSEGSNKLKTGRDVS